MRVPPGYTARVLISWGDPVSSGPAFVPDASNSAADQARQWGMHNDGVVDFPLRGSREGLLVRNSEYTDDVLLFPDGTANWNADKTAKSLNAHGVNIIHVRRRHRRDPWQVVRPSPFARRITGQTPIEIGGPLGDEPDDRMKTSADETGLEVLGTLNNCAMGFTPWGTYLTCEENFNGYFRKTAPVNDLERRCQEARDGRLVVDMGDDEQFEYIYRYVSNLSWRRARRRGINPLDDGILYVAKFREDGGGEWLPLTPDNSLLANWSYNDILINTRGAADAVRATQMDRPEWIDTFPDDLTAVATLTNNSARGVAGTNPRTGQPNAPVDAANPRVRNVYGHIIRWSYEHDFSEPIFSWDIFTLAGDPNDPADGANVNGDKVGSPDGLYLAPSGRLWIQTDVSGSTINAGDYAGFGNNQMLCADPSTKQIRRFLTGPNVCEVTGVFVTPDERTIFVGIQHPGEAPTGVNDPANPKRYSTWPGGPAGGRPRSSTIVITKDDGGEIGS